MPTAFLDEHALPRAGEILHARVRPVAAAIVLSVAVSSTTSFLIGAQRMAIASVAAVLVALTIGLLAPRIPRQRAGLAIAGLWWAVALAVLAGADQIPGWAIDSWMGLLFLAYAGIQLEPRWFATNLVFGGVGWSAAGILTLDEGNVAPRLITLTATLTLATLTFSGQRRYVIDLEAARASDEKARRALASALERTERELDERRRLEAERDAIRARSVAAQRLEAMGQMAGGVAHELNNILAAVLGIASLLRETKTGEEADDLDAIVAACKRGGELTHALLKFGRKQATDLAAIDLGELFKEIEPILKRAATQRATLKVTIPDRALLVTANRTDLAQAIANLCINAFDAGPSSVEVRTRLDTLDAARAQSLDTQQGEHVVIEVKDDGAGMPADVVARAFEPFFTTKSRGTGLGLAQVYGTARSVGGGIEVDSEVGRGTVVRLFLRKAEAPSPAKESKRPALGFEGKPVILVVDDEEMVRTVIARSLTRAGLEVIAASSGRQAREEIEKRHIDLAILDVAMPELDGLGTLRLLKEKQPDLPSMFLSGHVDDAFVESARASGASLVLTKPISPRELVAVVHEALRMRPAGPSTRASP